MKTRSAEKRAVAESKNTSFRLGKVRQSHYKIQISRANDRRTAEHYSLLIQIPDRLRVYASTWVVLATGVQHCCCSGTTRHRTSLTSARPRSKSLSSKAARVGECGSAARGVGTREDGGFRVLMAFEEGEMRAL